MPVSTRIASASAAISSPSTRAPEASRMSIQPPWPSFAMRSSDRPRGSGLIAHAPPAMAVTMASAARSRMRIAAAPEQLFGLGLHLLPRRREVAHRLRGIEQQLHRRERLLLAQPRGAHPFEVVAAAVEEQLDLAAGLAGRQVVVELVGVARLGDDRKRRRRGAPGG